MHYIRQFFEALLYPLRALLMSPGKVSSGARRLAAISLPARIAILVAVLMVFAVPAALYMYKQTQQHDTDWLQPTLWVTVIGLIVIVPLLLYYVLRLWLEGEISRFPDIDYAWKAGLAELRTHGLDLEYTPLFLVLGSSGELLEKVLFTAAQLPFRVREIPIGAAALHWFAEPNGIYLVCTDVGCLSKLAAVAKRAAEEARARQGRTYSSPAPGDNRRTMTPEEIRGTMVVGESQAPAAESAKGVVASQVFPAAGAAQPKPITGTFVIQQDHDDPIAREVEHKPVSLPQDVQREQELRLEYLCRLIVKARQPLAPLNGVLALLPYSIVQTGRREGTELQRAVKRDLNTLVRALKLRCPVTALVIGMEEESGFREMVRRLPREAAINQRYGKGFSVGNPPIPEQLEAVAAHACGLFEATTYQLFREKGSLGKTGNMKLYALLCKIRRTVRAPLTNILMNGFAHDPDDKSDADNVAPFFNGCYFAAVGESEDRQAFVKGVVEMLPRDQEELEWTEAALQDEDRYQKWSQIVIWLDALLLIALVGMVIWAFMFK
jgi:hypothetical protein